MLLLPLFHWFGAPIGSMTDFTTSIVSRDGLYTPSIDSKVYTQHIRVQGFRPRGDVMCHVCGGCSMVCEKCTVCECVTPGDCSTHRKETGFGKVSPLTFSLHSLPPSAPEQASHPTQNCAQALVLTAPVSGAVALTRHAASAQTTPAEQRRLLL